MFGVRGKTLRGEERGHPLQREEAQEPAGGGGLDLLRSSKGTS